MVLKGCQNQPEMLLRNEAVFLIQHSPIYHVKINCVQINWIWINRVQTNHAQIQCSD